MRTQIITAFKTLGCALIVALPFAACTGSSQPPPSSSVQGEYASLILADHPLAYWKLNETSGDLAHDSGSANANGSLTKVKLGKPGASPGTLAAAFTERNDIASVASIKLPDNSVFTSLETNFSLEAWLQVSGYASADVGCGNYTYGNVTILAFGNAGEFDFGVSSPGGIPFLTLLGRTVYGTAFKRGPIPDWIHLVFVRSGNTYNFYVNGMLSGSGNIPTTPIKVTGSGRKLGLGNSGELNSPMIGLMHDIAVYPVALDAQKIKQHFDFHLARKQQSGFIGRLRQFFSHLFK